jgi:hypothetical protein
MDHQPIGSHDLTTLTQVIHEARTDNGSSKEEQRSMNVETPLEALATMSTTIPSHRSARTLHSFRLRVSRFMYFGFRKAGYVARVVAVLCSNVAADYHLAPNDVRIVLLSNCPRKLDHYGCPSIVSNTRLNHMVKCSGEIVSPSVFSGIFRLFSSWFTNSLGACSCIAFPDEASQKKRRSAQQQ